MFSRYALTWSICALLLCVADAVELTDMFGEIQSPNFPDSYPSDSEVTWNISVPDGFKIKLYFMHFDLESSYLCEYDYVKVSCGIRGRWWGRQQTCLASKERVVLEKLETNWFSPFIWHKSCQSSAQLGEHRQADNIHWTDSEWTPDSELSHRGPDF